MSKLADRLLDKLSQEEMSYETFWKEYGLIIKEKKPEAFWKKLLSQTDIKKNTIIAKADIGYTYFYDIMRGAKHPSRDVIVKLCIAIEVPLKTCQKALDLYDWAPLSSTIRRDTVLIYAITHRLDLAETQSLLEKYNLKALW